MAVKIYSLKKQKLLVERKIKRCKTLKIKRFKNELNIQGVVWLERGVQLNGRPLQTLPLPY